MMCLPRHGVNYGFYAMLYRGDKLQTVAERLAKQAKGQGSGKGLLIMTLIIFTAASRRASSQHPHSGEVWDMSTPGCLANARTPAETPGRCC